MPKPELGNAVKEDLDARFWTGYMGPAQFEAYALLAAESRGLAESACLKIKDCRERTLALEKLEEAAFWMGKAIQRRGLAKS